MHVIDGIMVWGRIVVVCLVFWMEMEVIVAWGDWDDFIKGNQGNIVTMKVRDTCSFCKKRLTWQSKR